MNHQVELHVPPPTVRVTVPKHWLGGGMLNVPLTIPVYEARKLADDLMAAVRQRQEAQ